MNCKNYKAYAKNIEAQKQKEKLINKMLQKENVYIFKERDTSIAGICPDCGSIVSYNSYHKHYECNNKNCCFVANEKGERT